MRLAMLGSSRMKTVTVRMSVDVTLQIPDGFDWKCTEEDLAEMAAQAVCHHHDQSVQVVVQGVDQYDPPNSEQPNHAVFAKAFVEADTEGCQIFDTPPED
jgi:hypothetical protein